MRVLIDADGCPVVDLAIRCARDQGVEALILCDAAHVFEREHARTITVMKGADSVDFRLVNMIQPGDVAVTQDYGLAAMCLARGARAINQNGLIYSDDNIDALLLARYTARKIRYSGGRLRGPAKRTKAQDAAFRESMERLLSAQRESGERP